MRAGHLVLGNGVPIGLMDPFNPDSDGDGLKDGEEVSIRTVQVGSSTTLTFAFLYSNPMKRDSDGDGLADRVDPLPLVYTRKETLIDQSSNREGVRKHVLNTPLGPAEQADFGRLDLQRLHVYRIAAPWVRLRRGPDYAGVHDVGEFSSILNIGKAGATPTIER